MPQPRTFWILTLDEAEFGDAHEARASYEETYALAVELGDKRAMCQRSLIPDQLVRRLLGRSTVVQADPPTTTRPPRAGRRSWVTRSSQIEAATARLRFTAAQRTRTRSRSSGVRDRLVARRDPLRLEGAATSG